MAPVILVQFIKSVSSSRSFIPTNFVFQVERLANENTCSRSREAAYTYSILSAGVTHEIGRRCRLGLLQSCGCSQAPRPSSINEKWTWGGCGDNIEYGYRFSRDFIDVREKEEGFPKRSTDHGRSLMNRWNNEVGRRLLKRNTRPKCKCHGVSGSCNMKTCWMQLPTMRHMGAILLGKYHTAKRIQVMIDFCKRKLCFYRKLMHAAICKSKVNQEKEIEKEVEDEKIVLYKQNLFFWMTVLIIVSKIEHKGQWAP
ncbi:wnt family protein [Onchocerca flexuosa]|uniref:Protein Wnt n=1 Tax=Onchocerca flexuosa TaxID=387005 RepID=A0A238BSD1_9BILA|nr:wnt family protein [Onchocerca flexuosa]